jgi:hypothetical protein
MQKWFKRSLVAALLLTATLVIPEAQASASEASVSDVRNATAKFHDLDKATHAEYVRLLPCFDLPGTGGMGQHYVNTKLLDNVVDARQPEGLVYEVDGDRLQLVAVEYIIPQAAWTGSEPPSLLGHSFFRNDALGLWALHAWIWRPNPLGMFANYNPSVKLCPGH